MNIGILGGGQLGRMLALAGYPLGLRFRFFDPAPDAPAQHLGQRIVGNYADNDALDRFADGLDLVTYEFENVPVSAARRVAERVPVYPPPAALESAQDRLAEKTFFQQLNIPTPPFLQVDSVTDLAAAVNRVGLPAVLKTRRLGYDGKGQYVIQTKDEVEKAWLTLTARGATNPPRAGSGILVDAKPLGVILEKFIPFERELSILAARGRDGATVFYPLIENYHRDGILRLSLAPAPSLTYYLQAQAESFATLAMDALNYVGVLTIELFLYEGHLIASEVAPRVHNSGHWTIEGAATSQFENHLRALAGLPLGLTTPNGHVAMVNIIGSLPDTAQVLAMPGAHLHLYDKEPRPRRKLGHITLLADDAERRDEQLAQLRSIYRD
ncbi:MAG: 5-(carboxyamino)imidazole ribonucleotide synthase [Chloroflexota bacterium]